MAVHIYHYNVSSEQRYFLGTGHHDLYELVFINGNIVAHTPAGIASFVSTAAKAFFIDPQTHIFQHPTFHLKTNVSDTEKGEPPRYEFKPSIERLAREHLGNPFSGVIDNDRPLSHSDFFTDADNINEALIRKVCEKSVNFQQKILEESLDEEAKEFLSGSRAFQPKFIIAPYFYLSPNQYKQWLKITCCCYEKTKEIVADKQVYLFLVISKEALEKDLLDITQQISEISPDGIVLWVDDHREENLSSSEIGRYIELLKRLRNATDSIFNSHGGYLSILLCHAEVGARLNGVGHCINYGESRPVVPVGGGIPMARFYFPSIHSRLRFGDAASIVLAQKWLSSAQLYLDNICRCAQCGELIQNKSTINEAFLAYGESNPVTFRRRSGTIVRLEYPTNEAKQAAARHYLFNKAKEFSNIQNTPFSELLQNLEDAYRTIAPYSGDDLVAHLRRWQRTLQEQIVNMSTFSS